MLTSKEKAISILKNKISRNEEYLKKAIEWKDETYEMKMRYLIRQQKAFLKRLEKE